MGKVIITGTGRAGTSFLVHLLSALVLDTGYTEEQCLNELKNACQGGCEHTIEKPYKILKNPEFALDIEEILLKYDIEHVVIPIRPLEDVGKSRENNSKNHGGYGGFWNGCDNKEDQMVADAKMVYNLIEKLTLYNIPYTTIAFPRMVKDSLYLHNKLRQVFYEPCEGVFHNSQYTINFHKAHHRIANTDKITIK